MNEEITRAEVVKSFILAIPATAAGLAFFGFAGFVLYVIGG